MVSLNSINKFHLYKVKICIDLQLFADIILQFFETMFQLGSQIKIPKKQSNIAGNYTCINGKPAFRICAQKSCPNPSLCCQDVTCPCNEIHSLCTQIRLKSLLQKLYSKVADTTQIMTKFTNLFDSIIDRVSQIYDETQKRIKRYGLRHAQIKFLQHLQENRTNSLNGKIVHDAKEIADAKYDGEFWQIQLCVDRLWEELGGLFWGILYSTQDMYQIPTRVNRMNDDSGEEFFADLIEQTKITLRSLENKKMWSQKDFAINHEIKVNNNLEQKVDKHVEQQKQEAIKKIQQKVVEKQKPNQVEHREIRIQDLGYSDHQQERCNDLKLNQQGKLIGKNKEQQHFFIDNDVKQAVMSSQVLQQKKSNDDNKWFQKILRKAPSNEKPQTNKLLRGQEEIKLQQEIQKKQQNKNNINLDIEQLRKKEWMRQKIFPLQEEEKVKLKEQVQLKEIHKPQLVEHQQRTEELRVSCENSRSKLSIQIRNPYVQSKEFISAANYLCQILGFNLKGARQFIAKNGYNREGKLMSQQQILDLALIKTSSH